MLGLDLAFVEVSKWENEGASRPEAVALSNLSQGLPGFRGDLPEWSYQQAFHAKGTWRGGAKVLFPVSLVTGEPEVAPSRAAVSASGAERSAPRGFRAQPTLRSESTARPTGAKRACFWDRT